MYSTAYHSGLSAHSSYCKVVVSVSSLWAIAGFLAQISHNQISEFGLNLSSAGEKLPLSVLGLVSISRLDRCSGRLCELFVPSQKSVSYCVKTVFVLLASSAANFIFASLCTK